MAVLIKKSPGLPRIAKRTVKKITEDLLTFLRLPDRDLSIFFVGDKKITELNGKFFHKSVPTNVISFSYMDGLSNEVMGDIVISLERAQEESASMFVPFYERLFALIVHGLTHILGYDHISSKKDARIMRYREKKLLGFVVSHPLYQQLSAD